MRPTFAFALAALALGACAPDPGSPIARLDPAGVDGVWRITETMAASTFETTCTAVTHLVLEREGSALSGSYRQDGSCRDRFAEFDNSGSGEIQAGAIHAARAQGDVITWDDGTCAYTGVLHGGSMAGSVRCLLAAGGSRFEFTGRWQARRLSEPAIHTAQATDRQPDSCPSAETPAFYGRIPEKGRSSQSAART